MEPDKQIVWYKRKELWGMLLNLASFSPEIIQSFVDVGVLPPYTALAKLALPIGLILTVLGLKKGYKSENLVFQKNSGLPEGLRRNPFSKDNYIGE